ncbi:MAG TPA: hypothetical protein VK809_01080, partial [Bacteroidia bacterium]|nr:hypothetical protein [Bacteroidia bacterium]
MNYKKLPFFISLFTICLLAFGNQHLSAQSSGSMSNETYENIYIHWFFALDKTRLNNGISKSDFDLFTRFSQKAIDSLRGDFMKRIGDDEITTSNVGKYESVLQKNIFSSYLKFENIKQRYPSSVEEFRKTKAPYLSVGCDSACSNIDFETGNLSGWYAYYANNNSSTTSNNLNYITGGFAGAVTHAANDTLTSNPLFYNPTVGPNPKPDYQVNITSGNRGDQIVPSVPVVSPFGGHYSVMLGDSTHVNYGAAILSQTFLVGASNANFTYQYAVFLENPANHSYYQQPFFKVAVLDQNADTIPFCGEYYVVAKGGIPGFNSVYYAPSADSVYYKDWTIVNVPLKHYIGQCVTVVFEAVDCALGGHFSYAYIDASCSPLNIISSSAVFCGQDSIELTAPAGESSYFWTGPAGGITSSDTSRSISVVDTGIYTVVVTPFTGATCNDTLTIHIGKTAGPMPQPSFKADTVCVGGTTTFTNTSNPISGASFYWDFYNLGSYDDSTTNPTWKYNIPGIYTVKLHEVLNGCGIDTYLKVVVDSLVATSFIADTVCARDTVYFTNTSTG